MQHSKSCLKQRNTGKRHQHQGVKIDAFAVWPYNLFMAITTIKSTYSLDVESVRMLEALARHWKVSKSEVLRRALRIAAGEGGPGKTATGSLDRLQDSLQKRKVNVTQWEQDVKHERRATARRLPFPSP